jgi:hypothetical protein
LTFGATESETRIAPHKHLFDWIPDGNHLNNAMTKKNWIIFCVVVGAILPLLPRCLIPAAFMLNRVQPGPGLTESNIQARSSSVNRSNVETTKESKKK